MEAKETSKKIVLISYHYVNNPNFRSSALWSVIKEKDFAATFFYANWDHLNKQELPVSEDTRMKAIPVPHYFKNLSIRRSLSHLVFSFKLLSEKKLWEADLLVCSVPPNFVLIPAMIAKIFRPHIKIVCDVVDLWPEAIPLAPLPKRIFNAFAVVLWTFPRNIIYSKCDVLISHCEYFLKEIGSTFLPKNTIHLPLCLMDYENKEHPHLKIEKEIRFLLLGSINNIFDSDTCVKLLKKLSEDETKNIVLEIIGLGEGLDKLLIRLKNEVPKLSVKNHGAIFERDKKDKIMAQIHFGLNLYKSTTAIGVSYKSIEYLAHGIPIINSAQGDLFDLVLKDKIGFNTNQDILDILKLDDSAYQELRSSCKEKYLKTFSANNFEKQLSLLLNNALD